MMRHQYLFTTKLFFFFCLLCGTLVSCGWTVRRDRVSLLTQKKLFPLLSERLRGQRFKNSEYDTSVCNLMDHGGVVQADLEHLMTHLNFPPQTFSHFLIYYENFPLILKSPITESQHCLALTVCFSGCYCASFWHHLAACGSHRTVVWSGSIFPFYLQILWSRWHTNAFSVFFLLFFCVCDSHSALSYSKYLDQHSTHHCHFSLTDSSKIRRLGFMISILATILEEKLILAVTHKPVFYDLTLKKMFL